MGQSFVVRQALARQAEQRSQYAAAKVTSQASQPRTDISPVTGVAVQTPAERRSRTEATSKRTYAALDYAEAHPDETAEWTKTWNAGGETPSGVCPECEAMSGQTVRVDESFKDGNERPPAHPNCACSIELDERQLTFGEIWMRRLSQ